MSRSISILAFSMGGLAFRLGLLGEGEGWGIEFGLFRCPQVIPPSAADNQ